MLFSVSVTAVKLSALTTLLPSVVVIDGEKQNKPNMTYSGNVIYLSTFSKTLAPGLRLAWVVAPPEVISKLAQAKQGADLHTATFNQVVAYEVARGGFMDEHIRHIREVYGQRRDVMLEALEEYMPVEVRWTHPQGGLFLWATIPAAMNTVDVLKTAINRKVAFVPGGAFHPRGGGQNTMRLNFSNATPEKIVEGISRLAGVLKEEIFRTPHD